ncbi:MAG: hypothetical protein H7325_09515, partial [Pedobacter sp.]|nr:hypothetical protein [Pedobacter sp.]
DNNEFILKGTWPTPDGVYDWDGFKNYIFLDRIFSIKSNDTSQVTITKLSKKFTSLPKNWANIDAVAADQKNNLLLLFNNKSCQIHFGNDRKPPLNLSLAALIVGFPADINYVDASFIKEHDLYLFVKDKIIIAKRLGAKFKVIKVENLKNMVSNWPYAWGNGDLSAANYNVQEKTIYFYKNEQYITLSEKTHLATEPKKLEIKWSY